MSPSWQLPALLGGRPVRTEGPPDWPIPDPDVLEALEQAYRSGAWGKYHGGQVEELGRRLCQYFQVEWAMTCGSGTFAVELALRALKIEPGDEVVLAAYDYPGNFLTVHAVGAVPVLVDVAPDNWNFDPQRLGKAIGPRTRAVIVSHLHGGLVPMPEVMALARDHGLGVIEDAAQQPGGWVAGRRAGTWGDAGILSFGGSKLLTAGRGGALLTSREDVYQRARLWQNRGNVVNPLSELQAAVLLPQLDKLDTRNRQRQSGVARLIAGLNNVPGFRPFTNPATDGEPGYYKLGWQLDPSRFGLSRQRFVEAMRAEGIAFDEGFRALHAGRSPARFRQGSDLTEGTRAHEGCVILHHPVLLGTAADIDEVVSAVHKVHHNVEALLQFPEP